MSEFLGNYFVISCSMTSILYCMLWKVKHQVFCCQVAFIGNFILAKYFHLFLIGVIPTFSWIHCS